MNLGHEKRWVWRVARTAGGMTAAAFSLAVTHSAGALPPLHPVPDATTSPASQPARGDTKTFENKPQAIGFKYPAGWKLQRQVESAAVPLGLTFAIGPDDAPSGQMMVTVADVPDDSSTALGLMIGTYVSKFERSYKGFKVADQTLVKVAGRDGCRMMTTADGAKGPVHQLLYFTARGQKAYVFAYITPLKDFDADIKTFEEVIRSIEWLGS